MGLAINISCIRRSSTRSNWSENCVVSFSLTLIFHAWRHQVKVMESNIDCVLWKWAAKNPAFRSCLSDEIQFEKSETKRKKMHEQWNNFFSNVDFFSSKSDFVQWEDTRNAVTNTPRIRLAGQHSFSKHGSPLKKHSHDFPWSTLVIESVISYACQALHCH